MLLNNKVVVVSGIGPGLGIKLATEAASAGAAGLVIAARTESRLEEARQKVHDINPDCPCIPVVCDITQRDQCEAVAAAAAEHFGRVDGLVNSAFYHGNFEQIDQADLEDWMTILQTNVIGTMNMTNAIVPMMKAQKSGSVVMIGTMATRKPAILDIGGESGYAASKSAIATAAKYLAAELGPFGIRVNNVLMGWMWGEPVKAYVAMAASNAGVDPDVIYQGIAKDIPLRRIVTDEECAQAALMLLSDYASAVTGASLDANGGMFIPA